MRTIGDGENGFGECPVWLLNNPGSVSILSGDNWGQALDNSENSENLTKDP